ncbi:unnamed protein product, partial [Linum tenue]
EARVLLRPNVDGRQRRAPPQPGRNRRRPLIPPRSEIAGHQGLGPHHHIPGPILLQRPRSGLIRGRRAAQPHGRLVPPHRRRADLPPDAYRRRRPGPRRRRRVRPRPLPQLRAHEERPRGSVHERGGSGDSLAGLLHRAVSGQDRVGFGPAGCAAARDEDQGSGCGEAGDRRRGEG